MSWANFVAVAAGALGAILGGIATWRTRRVGTRANEIAEQANKIAAGQQQIAEKQQAVAERQLKIAEEQHRLEREREHDQLGPPQPAVIEAEVRDAVMGGRFLAGTITLPRDYRVRGEALVPASRSRQRLALDLVLRANQPVIFQIEDWPEGRVAPRTKALHLRFWPPNEELDGVPGRPCPCDRPDADGDGGGSGHWEWTVPVEKRMNPLFQELAEMGRRSKRSGDGGDPSAVRPFLKQLIRELQDNDNGPADPPGRESPSDPTSSPASP